MNRPMSFWDRRRAAVRAEEQVLVEPEAEADAPHAPQSDEQILAALDLPDPDTLKMGDDFTRFLAKAVPQHLRNRALRQLWRSNPVLACVDGLNDYDGDFLTGSTGNGPLKTTYQVGKGMLAHVQEMERQAEIRAIAADANDPEVVAAAEPATDDEDLIGNDSPDRPDTVAFQQIEEDDEDPVPAPRRMRFTFEPEAK